MKRLGSTLITIVVVILIVGAAGYFGWKRFGSARAEKDSNDASLSDYSAVFLTNGQVYFGKIVDRSEVEVDLRDIYYLQVNQQIQPDQKETGAQATATPQPNVVLVKLGEELHGPNDRMRINRDQVLFTETLKKDSKVVKAIDDYLSKQ